MIPLTEAVRSAILQELCNIHTMLPAKIVQYDYEKQKAQVLPVLKKYYTNGEIQELPLINNVPVVFPRSGGASLTFPVKEGDYCLLVFSERSMDIWKSTGGMAVPTDRRKFDLSDAVAIMGLFPFSDNSLSENNDDVLLTFKNSNIRLKSDGSIQIEKGNSIVQIGADENISINSTANVNITAAQMVVISSVSAMQLKTDSTVAIGKTGNELLQDISNLLLYLVRDLTTLGLPPTQVADYAALKLLIDSLKGVIT